MLLLNKDSEVSASMGIQQVPCSTHELSTPIVTTFMPSLDSIMYDGVVPSPSNIYDSSQFMDPSEYPLLNCSEESFLPLETPAKLKDDCASSLSISLLKSVAENVALQVKREIVDDSFYTSDCATSYANVKIKCEDQLLENEQCQMDNYPDIDNVTKSLMEHLYKEMWETSQTLGISPDPRAWSSENVQTWILFKLRQCSLPMINLSYFTMDGAALCSLTEADFRHRDINAGEALFTQFELWRAVNELYSDSRAFQPEDSSLDISAYLPSPQFPAVPGSIEGSPVASDGLSQVFHSDYSSDGCGFQSDDDLSEDGLEANDRKMNVVEGSSTITMTTRQGSHSHIHLWQFLRELLGDNRVFGNCIRWVDRSKGIFKIEDSVKVAKLWGKRKNRPAMNYDKLSRSIRQYYKKGIMKKTERSQRLVYQFCQPYVH